MPCRLNEQITARLVRLIDHDTGESPQIVGFSKALARAKELGLDLVEVDPTVYPPLCAIVDGTTFAHDSRAGAVQRKNVLFVCLHNSARSQMAAALFARASHHRHVVESAGTHAARSIHPMVIEVMREIGCDLSNRTPRQLDSLLVGCADVIVRSLAPDPDDYPWGNCSARVIDWTLPMPANEEHPALDEIRSLRDAIDIQARALAKDLGG